MTEDEKRLLELIEIFKVERISFYKEKLEAMGVDQSNIDAYIAYFIDIIHLVDERSKLEEIYKQCVDARYAHFEHQQREKCDTITNNITRVQDKLEAYKTRPIMYDEVMHIAGLINEVESLQKQLQVQNEFDNIIQARSATEELCNRFGIKNFDFQDDELTKRTSEAFVSFRKTMNTDRPDDWDPLHINGRSLPTLERYCWRHIMEHYGKMFRDFRNQFDSPSNILCVGCKTRITHRSHLEHWAAVRCEPCSDEYWCGVRRSLIPTNEWTTRWGRS